MTSILPVKPTTARIQPTREAPMPLDTLPPKLEAEADIPMILLWYL